MIAGIVEVGESVDVTLTATNIGSGTIDGAATLAGSGMFSIVGDGTYSIGANQSATVTVRFSPTSAANGFEDFEATVSFAGADNSPVVVTVKGTGTVFGKRYSFFGCAPSSATGGTPFANLLVVLLAGAALMALTRWYRRSQS